MPTRLSIEIKWKKLRGSCTLIVNDTPASSRSSPNSMNPWEKGAAERPWPIHASHGIVEE